MQDLSRFPNHLNSQNPETFTTEFENNLRRKHWAVKAQTLQKTNKYRQMFKYMSHVYSIWTNFRWNTVTNGYITGIFHQFLIKVLIRLQVNLHNFVNGLSSIFLNDFTNIFNIFMYSKRRRTTERGLSSILKWENHSNLNFPKSKILVRCF